MTLLRQERTAAAHSITTFGGDLISPSVLSGLTRGSQMIDLYNRPGVEVAMLGNHEFDYGSAVLAERIAASAFPWLASNVLGPDGRPALGTAGDPRDRAGGLPDRLLRHPGARNRRALVAPGTRSPSPILATARAAVERLEAEGSDLNVALTHDDLADDASSRAASRAST